MDFGHIESYLGVSGCSHAAVTGRGLGLGLGSGLGRGTVPHESGFPILREEIEVEEV